MTIDLKAVSFPDFGLPLERPRIPADTYAKRCDELFNRAGCDWIVVYADREHQANIAFLTGFEPRFEEALLLLCRGGRRIIVTGNESTAYTPVAGLAGFDTVLSQSMSLMGQDRSQRPNLNSVLRDCGLSGGQKIGIVGWKYLESGEIEVGEVGYFLPHHFVRVIEKIAGDTAAVTDVTSILMHQANGLRAIVDADEIAMLEWGAARASAAVWRVVSQIKPGESELRAAERMTYAGEPMSCHFMLSSNSATGPIIGLSSPSARILKEGDGVTTAVGYWGGLSARGGLLAKENEHFLPKAKGYFETLLAWYEAADVGVTGGSLYDVADEGLAKQGLKSALNPGHLLSHDEWMNTPVRRGSGETLRSGMPFQVDIIPVPMLDGQTLNCEDAIVFADEDLREELKGRHPEVFARMLARRKFLSESIGIDLKPSILPLSSTPLCLAPFWLKSGELLVRS